ncbi:MAG TPA: A24 family peptidase [Gemmatimonadaceae bacterium]|nr:A24 family peptidase [Gemmatimonadaceae bacterium]
MERASYGIFAGPAYNAVAGAVFLLLLLWACATDLRSRRIPNELVLCTALLGVVFSVVRQPALHGLVQSLVGLAVGLAIWFPFYLLKMIGAGDVKFFAAAAAWLGAVGALQAAFLSALFGAALAILWMVGSGGWRLAAMRLTRLVIAPVLSQWRTVATRPAPPPRKLRMPYGVAMAAGLAVAAWFPALLR